MLEDGIFIFGYFFLIVISLNFLKYVEDMNLVVRDMLVNVDLGIEVIKEICYFLGNG